MAVLSRRDFPWGKTLLISSQFRRFLTLVQAWLYFWERWLDLRKKFVYSCCYFSFLQWRRTSCFRKNRTSGRVSILFVPCFTLLSATMRCFFESRVNIGSMIYNWGKFLNLFAEECDTIMDCKPCLANQITICVSGYCGCKYVYSLGR